MQMTKKTLTALKLINWHYFTNQTINLKNTNLFSGDTGAGKSTILDAIQLLLTTDSRNFNRAANADSKRSLKTYVRGKTGEEGNEFLRKDKEAVISYIALEVYEESRDRYFVIGLKIDSPDVDIEPKKKWFCEEGRLDDLSFVVCNKPAKDEEFKNKGKKIQFIYQTSAAKERFRHRLGHLHDSFFELLPRSLAFKPMKNVKDFIYNFILPEREINTAVLRESIRSLKEMQLLVEELKKQVSELAKIKDIYEYIIGIEKQILVIDLLIKSADAESKRETIATKNKAIAIEQQNASQNGMICNTLEATIAAKRERQISIETSLKTGENALLINQIKNELTGSQKDRDRLLNDMKKLKEQLDRVKAAYRLLGKPQKEELTVLEKYSTELSRRNEIAVAIEADFSAAEKASDDKLINIKAELNAVNGSREKLANEIKSLESNKITYPDNVIMLKEAVEREFSGRGIDSGVYILADLLEISDNTWQNAVEGYLNTQRFHIIVEPQYFDIAAAIYDKMKSRIHTAALVNTGKLDLDAQPDKNGLANVVLSDNRFARAYICFLLGRVIMCDSVSGLKEHHTAITKECMLYSSKALRKIDPKVYSMPYIGKYALRQQLIIKKKEYDKQKTRAAELNEQRTACEKFGAAIRQCNFELLRSVIDVPMRLKKTEEDITILEERLQEAQNDPSYIELQIQADELRKEISEDDKHLDEVKASISKSEYTIEHFSSEITALEKEAAVIDSQIRELSNGHEDSLSEARKKYDEHKKTKSADTIFSNYQPRRQTLVNQHIKALSELSAMQAKYKDGELGTGTDVMSEYSAQYDALTRHDLIRYEEKLHTIQENCETEFRESFLAKMRENIENGKALFNELNRTLKTIRYGNDSYRFKCSMNERKSRLYDMIMSDFNIAGFNLFSTQFEEKYRDEMNELFAKLTDSDKNGDDVIREYTDYRSYLDYDIEILSSSGNVQHLSKIYREKSGGETQTPYYVAIAASFAQIYGNGETIRVIMLDEAFDKMDDERIESMLTFFKSQGLQMILAAPTSRLEVIGEQADNIVMVYTDSEHNSMAEEFSYDEI